MAGKKFKLHFGIVSIIAIVVFAVLLVTDLLLKHYEVADSWNFVVIENFIWVESGHKNTGSAFSMFAGVVWGRIFLVTISVVLILALCAAFVFLPERFIVLKIAIALIVAGAVGNLYDRLVYGYVRDFVWVNMLFTSACCNFADFFIVFGVIAAIADFLFLNDWALIPLTASAKAARERDNSRGKDVAEKEAGGEEQSERTENADNAEINSDKPDGGETDA